MSVSQFFKNIGNTLLIATTEPSTGDAIRAVLNNDAAAFEKIAAEAPKVLQDQSLLTKLSEQQDPKFFHSFLAHADNPNPRIEKTWGLQRTGYFESRPFLSLLLYNGNAVGASVLAGSSAIDVTEAGVWRLDDNEKHNRILESPLDIAKAQGRGTQEFGPVVRLLTRRYAEKYARDADALDAKIGLTTPKTPTARFVIAEDDPRFA